MPPPPLPPIQRQIMSAMQPVEHKNEESTASEWLYQKLVPITSASPFEQGGILLKDDGTWERVFGSPNKNSQSNEMRDSDLPEISMALTVCPVLVKTLRAVHMLGSIP